MNDHRESEEIAREAVEAEQWHYNPSDDGTVSILDKSGGFVDSVLESQAVVICQNHSAGVKRAVNSALLQHQARGEKEEQWKVVIEDEALALHTHNGIIRFDRLPGRVVLVEQVCDLHNASLSANAGNPTHADCSSREELFQASLLFAKQFVELFRDSDMRPEDECHELYDQAAALIAKAESAQGSATHAVKAPTKESASADEEAK